MIEIYSGLPGAGKTLSLARTGLELLDTNERFFKRTGVRRRVMTRIKFSPEIEERYEGFIGNWSQMTELVDFKDCDVLWDELQVDLDSTQWERTPLEIKRWLQMHRKHGVNIYGTAQDFPTIYIGVRRLTSKLYYMKKLIGSRDKTATKPPVKHPWGLILMRSVSRESFGKEKEEYIYDGLDWFFFGKELCFAYDTQQEIFPSEYPPLRHVLRRCGDKDCNYEKIVHI